MKKTENLLGISMFIILCLFSAPLFAKSFSLEYIFEYYSHEPTTDSSTFPEEKRITISPKGEFSMVIIYENKSVEKWEGLIPKDQFNQFVDFIITECKFLNLNKDDELEALEDSVDDAATEYITVTYDDKKHKIGGYAADCIEEFEQIFTAIDKLVEDLKYDKKIKKVKN